MIPNGEDEEGEGDVRFGSQDTGGDGEESEDELVQNMYLGGRGGKIGK